MTADTAPQQPWNAQEQRGSFDDAPPLAAEVLPALPTDQPRDTLGRALRHDGWTPARQCAFLKLVAQGHTVVAACRALGLTKQGAYALRDRAAGAAFALGWAAANLKAREPLADRLLERALDGQVERITRPDGTVVERHRFDNGLATRLLARLDKQAAGGGVADAAARLVAGEFEAFLDGLARDEGPARAGLFLATRGEDGDLEPVRALARADRYARAGAGLASEVATADLDLAARADWTAEQWARAEAAGLLRIAVGDDANDGQEGQFVDDEPVWWDEDVEAFRTRFPPPPDFHGWAKGVFGDDLYERELAPDELRIANRSMLRTAIDAHAAQQAERAQWFAAVEAELGPLPPAEIFDEEEYYGGSGEDAADTEADAPAATLPTDDPEADLPRRSDGDPAADGMTFQTGKVSLAESESYAYSLSDLERGSTDDHCR